MNHIKPHLKLDMEMDHLPYFHTDSSCPASDSSFGSYPWSFVDHAESCAHSISGSEHSFLANTPATPIRSSLSPAVTFSSDLFEIAKDTKSSMTPASSDFTVPSILHHSDISTENEDLAWMVQHKPTLLEQSFQLPDMAHKYISQRQDIYQSSGPTIGAGMDFEPSLSVSALDSKQPGGLTSPDTTPWIPTTLQFPPQTVEPRATLQPMLPSSPAPCATQSTDYQTKREESTTSGASNTSQLPSSPYSSSEPLVSIKVEPEDQSIQPTLVRAMKRSKAKGPNRRGRKNSEAKKDKSRPSRRAKPAVIERSIHACNVKDCTRGGGGPALFKKTEHRKRHEETCHGSSKIYCCWVEGCLRPFSRRDNLNSHLRNTHGRQSPAARNQYIATLDRTSPVFDPDFRGPFTKTGWPIYIE